MSTLRNAVRRAGRRAAQGLCLLSLVALAEGMATEAMAQGRLLRGPYLQLAGTNSLLVRWRTDAPGVSQVRFGQNPEALSETATATSATTNHSVLLSALVPDTRYYYAIGTTTAGLTNGPDFQFRTAPPTGSRRPVRLWVLGDFGFTNQSAGPVRDGFLTYNAGRPVDLWLMLGDNAYHGGGDAVWGVSVFQTYPAILRRTPLVSTIGNQETGGSANPPSTIPYFELLDCPTNGALGGAASGTEKYYSFDYGNIHFICLDSMSSARGAGSPMLLWLEEDLKQVTSDWTIAYWHHPPYSRGSNDSDTRTEQIEMRVNAVRLLEAYGVDLVLSGHSHSYERSYLIDGHYGLSTTFSTAFIKDGGDGRIVGGGAYEKASLGSAAGQGTVYAVTGSGASLGGGALNHPAMFRSLNVLGSMVLDVQANRLEARFIRETGAIDDSFTIIKGSSPLTLEPAVIRGEQIQLLWNSVAGRTYHVERSESLPEGVWSDISGPLQAADVQTGWTGPATQGFYRVRSDGD